jgi:methionine aminotransferase
LARFPKLAEQSIIVSSFGKTYHTTGWKMGYCMAPQRLMKEFRKIHQFLVYAVNTPIQFALAEFLKRKNEYLELGKFYEQKRDTFIELLNGSRFKIIPSKGTYFQLVDYSEITDEKDTEFATRLTKEYGVAAIPISVFYHDSLKSKILRFCFAKSDKTLEQAAERLLKI